MIKTYDICVQVYLKDRKKFNTTMTARNWNEAHQYAENIMKQGYARDGNFYYPIKEIKHIKVYKRMKSIKEIQIENQSKYIESIGNTL